MDALSVSAGDLPLRLAVIEPPRFRLALRPEEAAQALGVSVDYFSEHIAPELRWIRRGRLKLVAISEIDRWLSRAAAYTFPEANGR